MAQDAKSVEHFARCVGALHHEEHHWLQLIGTTAGLFHQTILSLQSRLITSNFPLRRLSGEDIPLTRARFQDHHAIADWESVEALRRMFNGCRVGDLRVLVQDRGYPDLAAISRLIAKVLRPEFGTFLGDVAFGPLWNRLEEVQDYPKLPHSRGWVLGTRHLMECSARLTEIFHAVNYMCERGMQHRIDPSSMLVGEYGAVYDLFHHVMGEPSIATHVCLAILCDYSLNGPYPPVLPMSGAVVDQTWSPAARFIAALRRLDGYRLPSRIDINRLDEVEEFEAEIYGALEETDPRTKIWRDEHFASLFSNVELGHVVSRMYSMDDSGWPTPTGGAALTQYIIAVTAEAYRKRDTTPALFSLPASLYFADNSLYRRHFDQIGPPLLRNSFSGLRAAKALPGWIEFFVVPAVHAEITRGLLMYDASRIAEQLAPYASFVDGLPRGTMAIVEMAIRSMLGHSSLADEIILQVGRIAAKRDATRRDL